MLPSLVDNLTIFNTAQCTPLCDGSINLALIPAQQGKHPCEWHGREGFPAYLWAHTLALLFIVVLFHEQQNLGMGYGFIVVNVFCVLFRLFIGYFVCLLMVTETMGASDSSWYLDPHILFYWNILVSNKPVFT